MVHGAQNLRKTVDSPSTLCRLARLGTIQERSLLLYSTYYSYIMYNDYSLPTFFKFFL